MRSLRCLTKAAIIIHFWHLLGCQTSTSQSQGTPAANLASDEHRDSNTPRHMLQMDGTAWAQSLTFSPSGKYLAASAANREVRVWNAATGEVMRSFSNAGNNIALGPDDRMIVNVDSSSDFLTFADWRNGEVHKIKIINALNAFSPTIADAAKLRNISDIAISTNGEKLLTISRLGGGVVIWDIATRQPSALIKANLSAATFSEDSQSIIGAGLAIAEYSIATGALKRLLQGDQDNSSSASWYDYIAVYGSKIIAARGMRQPDAAVSRVEVLEASNGNLLRSIPVRPTDWRYPRSCISLTRDGKLMLVLSLSATDNNSNYDVADQVDLINIESGQIVHTFQEILTPSLEDHPHRVTVAAIAPDGRLLALGYRQFLILDVGNSP